MTRTLALAGAVLATGGFASAQTSVGNPPTGTLAPATGGVATRPSTPAPAQAGDLAPPATPGLAAQKYKTEVVCKTSIQTGSLVAKKKTCLTRKQWQYVNDENERFAHDLVEVNTTK